jgi:hypothetical protein
MAWVRDSAFRVFWRVRRSPWDSGRRVPQRRAPATLVCRGNLPAMQPEGGSGSPIGPGRGTAPEIIRWRLTGTREDQRNAA